MSDLSPGNLFVNNSNVILDQISKISLNLLITYLITNLTPPQAGVAPGILRHKGQGLQQGTKLGDGVRGMLPQKNFITVEGLKIMVSQSFSAADKPQYLKGN